VIPNLPRPLPLIPRFTENDTRLLLSALAFVGGFAMKGVDNTKVFCDPHSPFQLTALFHVVVGLATGLYLSAFPLCPLAAADSKRAPLKPQPRAVGAWGVLRVVAATTWVVIAVLLLGLVLGLF